MPMTACPCGSTDDFARCCRPILDGAPAPTALALMRSRYTAFVQGAIDHIEATTALGLRADFDRAQAEAVASEVTWQGLEIVETSAGGVDDATGRVEFRARFSRQGRAMVHHEVARFHREDGRWVYAEGEAAPKPPPRRVAQVGRNEPCPCGSGRKFKKCCGG